MTVIAQSISAGFSYGNVTVFRKSGETFEILHIKCFVNSNNGEEYGAFEIFTIDKNDKKEIVEKTQSWWDKAKGAIIKATEIIKCIGGAISAFLGIVNDIKKSFSASSFLKIPWLLPLICLISLIF